MTNASDQVSEVDLQQLTPKKLWSRHVARRQPVLIHGIDDCWARLTDDFILEHAAHDVVMVEQRSGASDSFGQGRKVPMRVRDFMQRMQAADTSLYLSTQEVGVGLDGHPLLYGAPLVALAGAFPLTQRLLPHLVPQSINMWAGCAPHGSSSGLHHDFHDNLYVLLRGSKRFRLWPPSAAPGMYVAGAIARIHPSGRIVYEGQGDIRADGANEHDVRLWRAHNAADAAAAAVAAAGGDASQAADAEAALEQQLEAMLDEGAAAAAEAGGDELMDDYVDSDGDAEGTGGEEEDDEGEGGEEQEAGRHARSSSPSAAAPPPGTQQPQHARARPVAPPPPPSFSAVQLDLAPAELRRRFPAFPGASAALEVVLRAGDMLFLPAGWFHEVTSFGEPGVDGGHMAVNYWFHPPDNLDPSSAGFTKPYTCAYFPSIWAQRAGWLQAQTAAWWRQHKAKMEQPLAAHQHDAPPPPQQQQQQRLKRDSLAAAAAPAAAAQAQPARQRRRAHIKWAAGVADVGNAYEVSNTRSGTATGRFDKLPQQSGLVRPSDSSSDDGSDGGPQQQQQQQQQQHGPGSHPQPHPHPPPDDEQQHHQLGAEVADGLDALSAYFEDNPEAMRAMLEEFLAARRARLAAAGAAGAGGRQTARLPRLRGRRHHYVAVVRLAERRPKPKPVRH